MQSVTKIWSKNYPLLSPSHPVTFSSRKVVYIEVYIRLVIHASFIYLYLSTFYHMAGYGILHQYLMDSLWNTTSVLAYNQFCLCGNDTLYLIEYAHALHFVLLWFYHQLFIDSCDASTHILHSCFTDTGAIIWLPRYQWSNPERHGKKWVPPIHNKIW